MSAAGNCHDNAGMESFLHTLKTEFVHHETFIIKAEAKLKICYVQDVKLNMVLSLAKPSAGIS